MSVYRLKLRLSSWKYSLLPLLTFDSFPSFCIFPSTSSSNGPWLMLFVSSSLDALATRTLPYWFHDVLHVLGGKFIKFLLPFCIYNGKDLSNILKVFQRRRLNTVAEIEIHSRAHKCGHHDWHLPRWDYAYVFHQIAIAPSVPCVGAQVCHPKRLWQHFKRVVAMDGNFIWKMSLKPDSLGPSYRKTLGTLYCTGASRPRARIHPTINWRCYEK